MSRMTRTQISLQEEEYLFLKRQAERDNQSLAAVLRRLIRKEMKAQPDTVAHVADLAGLIETSPFTGADHDVILYGGTQRR